MQMYLLKRLGRDDDYVAVIGDLCAVHSSLLKRLWNNPDKVNLPIEIFTSFESYYGESKDVVLSKAELLWSK